MGRRDLKGSRQVLQDFDWSASLRAIYVDYEGNKHAPPTLLGWRVDGHERAAIVEPLFATCSARLRARHATAAVHEQAVAGLVDQAVFEGRHIVSWSVHDLELMHAVLDQRGQQQLLGCYVNALDVARPWHRRVHGCVAPGGARLAYFASLFDFEIPAKYGQQVVGANLGALRRLLQAGSLYADFSLQQKRCWTTVARHNLQDLRAMDHIVRTIKRHPQRPTKKLPAQCA